MVDTLAGKIFNPKKEMSYPSSEGEGHEPTEIRRPPAYDTPRRNSAIDTVKIRDWPMYAMDQLKSAASNFYDSGGMGEVLDNLIGHAQGSGMVDSATIKKLESLSAEAHRARTKKDRNEIYTKAVEVLGSLRTSKRR